MTHTSHATTFLKKIGTALLVTLLLFTGTAVAGTIFIDTSGLSGNVGETTQVPVKVTDANNLFTLDLQFNTGDTASAAILFNETSMQKYGFIYSQNTGIVANVGMNINGDQTLFYLDVTPKTASNINMDITLNVAKEGTAGNVGPASYTASGAVLGVTGSGTSTTTPTESTPSSGNQDTGTQTPTATPTVTATQTAAVPTETKPAETTPTETVPTETVPTLPSSSTTTKSPSPLLGLLAGFGTAFCIARKQKN